MDFKNYSILRDAVNLLTQQNGVMQRDLIELKEALSKLSEHIVEIRKPNYQLITIAIGLLAAFVTYYTASSISPVNRDIDKLTAEVQTNKQFYTNQAAAGALHDQELNRNIQTLQTGIATIRVNLSEIETQFNGLYTLRNQDKANSTNALGLLWQEIHPDKKWPSETYYPSPHVQMRPTVPGP